MIYEPPYRRMKENLVVIKYNEQFSSLIEARDKIKEIKEKLNSDNPILVFFNSNQNYSISDDIIHPPYVLKV